MLPTWVGEEGGVYGAEGLVDAQEVGICQGGTSLEADKTAWRKVGLPPS